VDSPGSPSTPLNGQITVQRKLGRCLLRLQQLERLLKHMNAHAELSGTPQTLEANRVAQVDAAATQTLGQLVRSFTSSHLTVATGADVESTDDEPGSGRPGGEVWMRFRFAIEMTAENHAQAVKDLLELRDLRNELVHHLIERFNVWTSDGCDEAACHLDEAYERIDRRYLQVSKWASDADLARRLTASLMATQQFEHALVHGIAPDGTVLAWPFTPVVAHLSAAGIPEASDGWRRLEDAITRIRREHPEETPSRYQCSSWRHLLHESQLFEVRKAKPTEAGATVVWYRRKPEGP
jgi:hypothetical protein